MWLEQLRQDVRFGALFLRRNPAFALVAILTLALGIGLTTAVFSVVNAVLIRPLPYPHADRLVWLTRHNTLMKSEVVSGIDFLDWKEQSKSFDEMVAYGYSQKTLVAAESAEQHWFAEVTAGFWDLSGATPAHGRLFTARDRDALVLSDGLFERRFGRDPAVIGSVVTLNGRPVTIFGVLPRGFQFVLPQPGLSAWRRARSASDLEGYLLNPISPGNEVRGGPMSIQLVSARLRTGVPLANANSELQQIHTRISAGNGGASVGWSAPRVMLLQEKLVGDARLALLILSGAVGLVLLTACASIAGLLVARTVSRRKEIAIRTAIGASRSRVIRQFASENLLLGFLGGALGLLLAHWIVLAFVRLAPHAVPRLGEANLDWRVLLFAIGITFAAVVLSGFVSIPYWGRHPFDELKQMATSGSTGLPVRRVLVAGEVALAIILLTGAGLLIKSFWRLSAHPPGFDPEHTLMLQVELTGPDYLGSAQQMAYFRELLSRVRKLPGVRAASLMATVARGPIQRDAEVNRLSGQTQMGSYHAVSASFGSVLGLRLVRGRWLDEHEPRHVVMINESFARTIFGSSDPIGQRIMAEGLAPSPRTVPATVVGVVADLNYKHRGTSPEPEVYVPYLQTLKLRSASLMVRAFRDTAQLMQSMRVVAADIDRTQPPRDLMTLEKSLAESVLPQRFNLTLLGGFAVASAMVALVGIYGMISYSVSIRTPEIGMRVVLGASGAQLVRMIVGQSMRTVLAGIAVGIGGAFGLTRLMSGMLFQVRPTDPVTFGVVAALLTLSALVACWIPARRAAQLDPIAALRHDADS